MITKKQKAVIASQKWKKANLEKVIAFSKRWRENNPHYQIDFLYKKYNFSGEDYIKLNKKQKGLCAICKKPNIKRRLAVDHCHETNVVRGLLCHKCNFMLGLVKDDIKILKSAIKYLS